MSLTYGFFNAKKGDRTYNAEQMSSLFAGIIQDGVFKDYPASGNQLTVTPSSKTLKVNVGPGRAWFKNIWVDNDGIVTLSVSRPATAAKKSAVVLEIRKNDTGDYPRQARLIIVDGNGTTLPTMVRDDTRRIYQYMLAYLDVPASSDTSWNGVFDANKIHNRVGVNGGIPYAVVPVDAVINNRISSDLANYLNDDGSALYQFLSGKFNAVNSIISDLSSNFKKLFYFRERDNDGSSNYYGHLGEKGETVTIRSMDTQNGGMSNAFHPGIATVVPNDCVISSSGKVGHITGLTRNATTGALQTVSIKTIGSIWEDPHYTSSLVYLIERDESESAQYYGALSDTILGTATIVSKNTTDGGMPSAWWPASHVISVGDAVVGSRGNVGRITEVVRSSTTGQLKSVTIETRSKLLSAYRTRLASAELALQNLNDWYSELDNMNIDTRLTAIETWKGRGTPVQMIELRYDVNEDAYIVYPSFEKLRYALEHGIGVTIRLMDLDSDQNQIMYEMANIEARYNSLNQISYVLASYRTEDRRGSNDINDWRWNFINAEISPYGNSGAGRARISYDRRG